MNFHTLVFKILLSFIKPTTKVLGNIAIKIILSQLATWTYGITINIAQSKNSISK